MPISVAPELQVKQYIERLGLNPLDVLKQDITARSSSSTNLGFNVDSPMEGALLDSEAMIRWEIGFQAIDEANPAVPQAFPLTYWITEKFMPIHSAAQSATIAINSGSTNYVTFDYWLALCMVTLDEREMDGKWDGGRFPVIQDMRKLNLREFSWTDWIIATPVHGAGVAQVLYHHHNPAEWELIKRYLEWLQFGEVAGAEWFNNPNASVGLTGFKRLIREPVALGVFNPFKGLTLPSWSAFAHMSPVIPHVHTLSLYWSLVNFLPHIVRFLIGPDTRGFVPFQL